jgi:2-polyprenyl-3-methyl-5-hydroxy-6-metoxy-1,4-benzoquinol methylase
MEIQQFYNQNQFPGIYTIEDFNSYGDNIENPYLRIIDKHLGDNTTVLDAGCGTGLITNLFAYRYPTNKFVAVDFADGIDYAQQFGKTNNINNAKFIRQDLLEYTSTKQFDVVICQGVLHHIPDWHTAIAKLKTLVKPGGKLILGLYHPWGKIAKKFFNINYGNTVLYKDQELVPYELSFSVAEVKNMTQGFNLIDFAPTRTLDSIEISALFNYRNGGLVTYILKKKQ